MWSGACLSGLMAALAAMSWRFPYEVILEEAPLGLYVGLSILAGGVLLAVSRQLPNAPESRGLVWGVVAFGLLARGAMFLSTPVLEDDSYRYFWDGAVTAHGVDPYKYAPIDAAPPTLFEAGVFEQEAGPAPNADLQTLQALAAAHPETHRRINYPYIATIYPPLTQLAFAGAYALDPFGMAGWRIVLLGADIINLLILMKLLRAHGRSLNWVALYWWNPVVIMQGFNAGHMDILVLPFLLGALLLARQGRLKVSALALAGAAGVKLWPILLFPLIARPLLAQPLRLVGLGGQFIAATGLLIAPQILHAFRPEAGLNAYSSDWRTHAFVFAVLEDGVFRALPEAGRAARFVVLILMSALAAGLGLRFGNDSNRLPALATAIIAGLIFLSPTGYPWYLIWIAPLLALRPNPGLICLMASAPLYWLRFAMGDDNPLYQWGVVPLAFGLPLIVAVWSLQNKEFARCDQPSLSPR